MEAQHQTETPAILAGLSAREQTAAAFGVHPRTLIRWEHAGLPVIKLGKQRLHRIESVRAWLLAREASAGSEPPRRGRPPKAGRAS